MPQNDPGHSLKWKPKEKKPVFASQMQLDLVSPKNGQSIIQSLAIYNPNFLDRSLIWI